MSNGIVIVVLFGGQVVAVAVPMEHGVLVRHRVRREIADKSLKLKGTWFRLAVSWFRPAGC